MNTLSSEAWIFLLESVIAKGTILLRSLSAQIQKQGREGSLAEPKIHFQGDWGKKESRDEEGDQKAWRLEDDNRLRHADAAQWNRKDAKGTNNWAANPDEK